MLAMYRYSCPATAGPRRGEDSLADDPHTRLIVTAPGIRQFQTILHWRHPYGPAHCLARVHLPDGGGTMAIVSEIRSNSRERRIGEHIPLVADALLTVLPPDLGVRPQDVKWFVHVGEFSSYDALDAPEDFVRITLDWDGGHYRGDISGHHIMSRPEVDDLLRRVPLAPMPEVLRELGWTY
jgi:hypothetical protein